MVKESAAISRGKSLNIKEILFNNFSFIGLILVLGCVPWPMLLLWHLENLIFQ